MAVWKSIRLNILMVFLLLVCNVFLLKSMNFETNYYKRFKACSKLIELFPEAYSRLLLALFFCCNGSLLDFQMCFANFLLSYVTVIMLSDLLSSVEKKFEKKFKQWLSLLSCYPEIICNSRTSQTLTNRVQSTPTPVNLHFYWPTYHERAILTRFGGSWAGASNPSTSGF